MKSGQKPMMEQSQHKIEARFGLSMLKNPCNSLLFDHIDGFEFFLIFLVLLAIHKNWNQVDFGSCALDILYRNAGWEFHSYGFDINHHIRFLGVSRGQLLNLQNFMPIMNTVVLPSTLLGQLLALHTNKKPMYWPIWSIQ